MNVEKDIISNNQNKDNNAHKITNSIQNQSNAQRLFSKTFICKKTLYFKTEKEDGNHKNKNLSKLDIKEGRWSKEEHEIFLDGIVKYGMNWKKVKASIEGRTSVQVRSHAQKFFRKLKMCKDVILGIDFTADNIINFRDMINQIKLINPNYNIKNIFKYLTNKFDNIKKNKKINGNQIIENNEDIKEINDIKNIINLDEKNNNENYLINNNYNTNQGNEMNSLDNLKQIINLNQQVSNNQFYNNIIYFSFY